GLDEHVPAGHPHVFDQDLAAGERAEVEPDIDAFGDEKGTMLGLQTADAEVLDDDVAREQPDGKTADRQLAFEIARTGALGGRPHRRAEIHGDGRDDRDGEQHRGDDGDRPHEPDRAAPPGARGARRRFRRPALRRGGGVDVRPRIAHSMITSVVPASTDAPSCAVTSRTTPERGARSSFSIVIASTTPTPCLASTWSPGATRTRTIFPGIGARTRAGPSAAAPVRAPGRPITRLTGTRTSPTVTSKAWPSCTRATVTSCCRPDAGRRSDHRPWPIATASTSTGAPSSVTASPFPRGSSVTTRTRSPTSNVKRMSQRSASSRPARRHAVGGGAAARVCCVCACSA